MAYEFGNFGNLGADQSTLDQFKTKIAELFSAQKKVDAGLARMPAGPNRDRLMKLRAESRGIFQNYILPFYNKAKEFIGMAGDDEPMGVVPLVAWAALSVAGVGATAALGYVTKSLYTEYKILNDPAFTSSQKTELLKGGGIQGISTAINSARNLVIVAVVGYAIFKYLQMRKSA